MLGPVFWWESIRSGRRGWVWWSRIVYVAVLLVLLLGEYYRVLMVMEQTGLSPFRAHAALAHAFYARFSLCQLLAVTLLAPLYGAGPISEEKSRRTLGFLLASKLTAWEIVASKIGLAVLRVWQVILAGLPLCALALLLGGVDAGLVFADFLVALATAFASIAMAFTVALFTRRQAEALLLTYLMQVAWFLLPLLRIVARDAGTSLPLPDAVFRANAFVTSRAGQEQGFAAVANDYAAVVGLAIVLGVAFGLLGWFSLRPTCRRHQARGERRRDAGRRERRVGKQRVVWERRPLLWRELRCRRAGWVDRLAWVAYGLGGALVLLGVTLAWPSPQAMSQAVANDNLPGAMLFLLWGQLFGMTFLAIPFIALTAATAVVEERDAGLLADLQCSGVSQATFVDAKSARLAWVTGRLLLLPVLLAAAGWWMGWASVVQLPYIAVAGLAPATFVAQFGLLVALWVPRTKLALPTTLGFVAGITVFLPLLASVIVVEYDDAVWYDVANPGFLLASLLEDAWVLADGEFGTARLDRPLQRAAAWWTVAWSVAAVGCYLVARFVPVAPWRQTRSRRRRVPDRAGAADTRSDATSLSHPRGRGRWQVRSGARPAATPPGPACSPNTT